jgi:uncharacterized hydrophobic protein (TIGR00271 family)
MPLLRITCPSRLTDHIVGLLHVDAAATDVVVIAEASRLTPGDLVLAEVPRAAVDELLVRLSDGHSEVALHLAVVPSERLLPPQTDDESEDDEAVIWAQVIQDVHGTAQLSWINVLLIVIAAAIAAIGIIEDQLLLIVGAMAMSPDYYPIADTCLALVRGAWEHAIRSFATLVLGLAAGTIGAWTITAALSAAGLVDADIAPSRELTLFITRPDGLSVVVALLAGVAGALAITLADSRGLVGVFVSVTTIPAAANIGVGLASGDASDVAGGAVQLAVNVTSLLLAGTATLAIRRRLRQRRLRA